MGFLHRQGQVGQGVGAVTTVSVVLLSPPTYGNLVCVVVQTNLGVTSLTVQDSNGNPYTVTPNSPSTPNTGQIWLAYLLSAPANASATITANWTTAATGPDMWADEFMSSGGTVTFDKDVSGTGTGININTPSITPTFPNSLLYSGAATPGSISAPTAGATLGVWTGSGGGIPSNGNNAEYDVNASSATPVQYTNSNDKWSSMAMSFYLRPSNASAVNFNTVLVQN